MIELTSNELSIMQLLWAEGRALSRAEIIDKTRDRQWQPRSIHILLNKLMEKDAIRVEGFVRSGKTYGRTYGAAISRDQYIAQLFFGNLEGEDRKLPLSGVVAALIENKGLSEETLEELESLLKELRKKITQ